MGFDSLVTHPGRLSILVALAAREKREFVDLRRTTHLTDGNLACHTRRLTAAGMVEVEKHFRAGKPVTEFRLTPSGRAALHEHVEGLVAALRIPGDPGFQLRTDSVTVGGIADQSGAPATHDEDWVD